MYFWYSFSIYTHNHTEMYMYMCIFLIKKNNVSSVKQILQKCVQRHAWHISWMYTSASDGMGCLGQENWWGVHCIPFVLFEVWITWVLFKKIIEIITTHKRKERLSSSPLSSLLPTQPNPWLQCGLYVSGPFFLLIHCIFLSLYF